MVHSKDALEHRCINIDRAGKSWTIDVCAWDHTKGLLVAVAPERFSYELLLSDGLAKWFHLPHGPISMLEHCTQVAALAVPFIIEFERDMPHLARGRYVVREQMSAEHVVRWHPVTFHESVAGPVPVPAGCMVS